MCNEGASGEVSSEILRGVDYWHVVAASVRGTSHQKRQQPCQDAHYWGTVHDDVLVAAVADGASSAALGKVGATLAVCAAATTVCARHQRTVCPENDAAWRQWLVDAMRAAQATVVAEAQARQVTVRELATTLILVVAMPARVAVAQIGDGAVVVSDMAGNLFPLTVLQHGEYPNESNILVTDTALVTLVDTDSFQVREPHNGGVYRCPVGKPEFTPLNSRAALFHRSTARQNMTSLA